jgi:hypothetical protein
MTHTGLRDRALILAPIGRDTAVAAGVLDQIGITSVVCRDLAELITGLELGAGTAIVTVEALRREPLEPLTDWLDAQPAWSDFPFVMLTGAGSVAQDGGDIVYKGYRDGHLYLSMHGACSGCPSSTVTLKRGIESLIRHYVPEVESVEAV